MPAVLGSGQACFQSSVSLDCSVSMIDYLATIASNAIGIMSKSAKCGSHGSSRKIAKYDLHGWMEEPVEYQCPNTNGAVFVLFGGKLILLIE